MKKLITTLLTAAITMNICAFAQTNTYTGSSGGTWSTATNWSTGTVPTLTDNVLVNNGKTVNLLSSNTAAMVTLDGNNARLNILGASLNATGLTMTGSSGSVPIYMDGGTLTLNNGAGSIATTGNVQSFLHINGPVTMNLASANLTYLWLKSGGGAPSSLSINTNQTYNTIITYLASAAGQSTLDINGGTLNGGTMILNVLNGSITNTVNLNNGVITANLIRRDYDGSSVVFNFNDGIIANKTNSDLTITRGANATQNMVISLSEYGTHNFNADTGRTITVSSTATLANKTGESGTLNKTGNGTLLLQGNNTYTGTTTVNAGTLIVNGSLLSSNTIVATGATLKGSGSLQSVTLQDGTLSPGNSPGLLSMTSLDASNGNFVFEIGSPASRGATYDAIDVTGLLTLGSNTAWNFSVVSNYAFQLNDTYNLFNWGSIDTAGFDIAILEAALPNLNTASTDLKWNVSNFTIDGTVSVIPEPDIATLFVLGVAGLLGTRIYNKKSK